MAKETFDFEALRVSVQTRIKVNRGIADEEVFRITALRHEMLEILTDRLRILRHSSIWLDKVTKKSYRDNKLNGNELLKSQGERMIYVKGGDDYAKAALNHENVKTEVDYLEGVIKELDNLTWSLRDSMKFQMFLAGK